MDTKKVEISPTFRKLFPDEAKRAEQYGIPIGTKPGKRILGYPVFYALYRTQLTGYESDSNGPLQPADVPRIVKSQMDKIISALDREAASTDRERFDRIVDILQNSDERLNIRMIVEAHLRGRDVGSCYGGAMYDVQITVNGKLYKGRGQNRPAALADVTKRFEEMQHDRAINAL
jgi:hypothetical protein